MRSSFQTMLVMCFFSLMVVGYALKTNRSALNGMMIRVAAFHFPPMFTTTKNADGNYTYGGIVYELVRLAVGFFNMNASFVHIDPSKYKDGVLTFLDLIRKKEVDLTGLAHETSLHTLEDLAMSFPFSIVNYALLQRFPEEESRLLAPIRPFTFEVWMGFLASTVGFMTFMNTLALFQNNKIKQTGSNTLNGLRTMLRDTERTETVSEIIYGQWEYVVTIITGQGNCIRYSARQCIRIAVSAWLLAMVVIVYAYTGVLTAVLSVPKLKPILNTFEDVVAANQTKITIGAYKVLTHQILSATSGTYKIVGDSFREDPSLLVANNQQGMENVLHRGCAFPMLLELGSVLITVDKKLSGKCRFTMSPKMLPYYVNYQAGFQKDGPFKDTMEEHFIIPMWDNGMLSFLMKNFYPTSRECRTDKPRESKTKSFSLRDLTAPFFILGSGLSLAFIAFVIEKTYYWVQKRRANVYF